MKAIFFSLLFFIAFVFLYFKRREQSVKIIILSLPFSYTPLFTETFGKFIPISISGILIILLYILTFWRKKLVNKSKSFTYLLGAIFFILIWGGLFAFANYKDALDFYEIYSGRLSTQLSELRPIYQYLFHSTNLIICIMFIKILSWNFFSIDNIKNLCYVFSLTIIPNFIFQILQITGYSDILGGLFVEIDYSGLKDPRFFGLYNHFGFGVYISMIIGFSLYFKFKNYIFIITTTVLYSLLSGQRQAIVDMSIILMVFLLFANINLMKKVFYLLVVALLFYVLFFVYSDAFVGIYRLWSSIELIEQNEILAATGRDVKEMPRLLEALKTWPITGKGLFNWGYFLGVNSYYADHVVIFNIYQKVGIIGFLLFFFSLGKFLLSVISNLIKGKYVTKNSAILGLLLAFLVNQFIDNFFWFTNTMLIYIFLFCVFFGLLSEKQIRFSDISLQKSINKSFLT
ncbi:MAG: hypothetical protein JXB49_36670 [Bacteroidales bacterium]|nr:hypothetical protein [Bacteroidales bacterium]